MTANDLILVPTDFEPASMRALAVAQRLAPPLGARIVLLHVADLPVFAYPPELPQSLVTRSEEIYEAAQRALDAVAKRAGGLETELRRGVAHEEILAAITERQPKLVVMGTHGRGSLARLLVGSVASVVVRASPVPVLTVRADATLDEDAKPAA